jgi:hypothetical protein
VLVSCSYAAHPFPLPATSAKNPATSANGRAAATAGKSYNQVPISRTSVWDKKFSDIFSPSILDKRFSEKFSLM